MICRSITRDNARPSGRRMVRLGAASDSRCQLVLPSFADPSVLTRRGKVVDELEWRIVDAIRLHDLDPFHRPAAQLTLEPLAYHLMEDPALERERAEEADGRIGRHVLEQGRGVHQPPEEHPDVVEDLVDVVIPEGDDGVGIGNADARHALAARVQPHRRVERLAHAGLREARNDRSPLHAHRRLVWRRVRIVERESGQARALDVTPLEDEADPRLDAIAVRERRQREGHDIARARRRKDQRLPILQAERGDEEDRRQGVLEAARELGPHRVLGRRTLRGEPLVLDRADPHLDRVVGARMEAASHPSWQ
jgi:hypothetical protein